MKDLRLSKGRKRGGAVLTEFAAAFVVLVVFIFMPLANLSFIGVRFFIAQGAVQEFVHRLALSDKRSDSYAALTADNFWRNFCDNCGVGISAPTMQLLVISTTSNESISLQNGQPVPPEWLPGGSKSPCIYNLNLKSDISVPPIYNGGPAVPGITAPISLKLEGHSAWENLSRDPASSKGEYFINE